MAFIVSLGFCNGCYPRSTVPFSNVHWANSHPSFRVRPNRSVARIFMCDNGQRMSESHSESRRSTEQRERRQRLEENRFYNALGAIDADDLFKDLRSVPIRSVNPGFSRWYAHELRVAWFCMMKRKLEEEESDMPDFSESVMAALRYIEKRSGVSLVREDDSIRAVGWVVVFLYFGAPFITLALAWYWTNDMSTFPFQN